MTWPPTFPSGSILTSTQQQALIGPPRCRAYDGTGVSTGTGTLTLITLSAETYDSTGSMHSTSTNPSRITAPYSGDYDIVGGIAWPTHADTGERYCEVRKNAAGSSSGGTVIGLAQFVAASSYTYVRFSDLGVPLNAGDYIELFGAQYSSATLTTSTGDGITYLALIGRSAT